MELYKEQSGEQLYLTWAIIPQPERVSRGILAQEYSRGLGN
jgi:hypothetical protein